MSIAMINQLFAHIWMNFGLQRGSTSQEIMTELNHPPSSWCCVGYFSLFPYMHTLLTTTGMQCVCLCLTCCCSSINQQFLFLENPLQRRYYTTSRDYYSLLPVLLQSLYVHDSWTYLTITFIFLKHSVRQLAYLKTKETCFAVLWHVVRVQWTLTSLATRQRWLHNEA